MKRYLPLSLLLLSFLILAQSQNGTQLTPNTTITITLNSTSPISYMITVPNNLATDQDLYVHAQPTLADPLQVPQLTLLSYNDYKMNCYNAHEEFAGICKIPAKELIKGRSFILTLKCSTQCTLDLQTYFSPINHLKLGEDLELTAYAPSGLTQIILIQIPQDANYTAISLVASIINIEQQLNLADQKLDMLINYGNQNVTDPTDDLFMEQGLVLFTGGQGIYLPRETIQPGSIIKVYLKLQIGISILFSAAEVHPGNERIKLGRSYFEFMQNQGSKVYSLDLTDKKSELSNKTIEMVFDIYSGNPVIIIAFDNNFTNVVPYSRKSSATSYSISPNLRQNYNFTGIVYVAVSASMPSEYYLYTKLIRQDVTFLEPYLTYFDQIQQNEVENYLLLQRYSFEWGTPFTLVNYTFKIETVQGKGYFKIKRCKNIEAEKDTQPNLEDCLISTPNELSSAAFRQAEIESKQIGNPNKFTIQLQYNTITCSELKRSQGKIYKECGFQLIAVGQSVQPFIFSLTVERKFHTTYLKQNTVVKDYLPKNSYVYYAFSLPSLTNITRIQIFETTFSGQAALIVSTTQTIPTLQSPFNQIETHTGEKSKIVLQRNQIAKDIYISIYAYQFTQVNLGVIVHRDTDTTDNNFNTIILEKGNLLTYTLDDQFISFKFNSQGSESIVVSLNELAGHCTFKVFDQSKKQLDCIGKNDNALICQVTTTKDTDYHIEVTGARGKRNKFTISYKGSIDQCTAATLNLPIDVVLHASESECFTFPVNRNIDLRFVGSFSHSQLTNKQISVDLYAGDSRIITFDGTHLDIPVRFLTADCPLGLKKPGFMKTCPVSIEFLSRSDHSSTFTFILEQQDAQLALFDGIVQKVSDLYVQNDGRKHFYYHLYSQTAIKIFLTAQTFRIEYLLLAKLVNQQTFLNRNEQDGVNLYREYSQLVKDNYTDDNLYTAVVKNIGTSILSIPRQFIVKHCPTGNKECFLLISVAPIGGNDGDSIHDPIIFEIEVTQEQTYLQLGDTKTGFIEQNEIYTYLVDPEDAIVNLRNINQQSRHSLACANIFTLHDNLTLKSYSQNGDDLQLKKQDKIDKIYVHGDAQQCSYQISYISLNQPTKTARLATPYELDIISQDISTFLFYNTHPVSFRILQMASAGSANIYIFPFDEDNLTLAAVAEMDYLQFPIIESYNGDYIISSSNPYFCSQCFYYVVVTTKTAFIGQIIFLRLTDSIPLSVGHIFKQKLSPLSEIKYEEYVFYSLTDFNIAFQIFIGKIQVHITNPKGEVEVEQIIKATKNFTIKAVEYESKSKIEFFSPKAMYHIRIVAVTQVQFYIRVSRAGASQRIFQGYPITIAIDTITTIEFVNSQQLDKPITLMTNIDSVDEDVNTTHQLSVEFLAYIDADESFLNTSDLVTNIVESDQTMVFNLKNVRGTYFISIETSLPMKVTFLLLKNQLTHLSPSANHLFNTQGIFELTSNQHNVMIEIFNCRGDLTVTASKEYDDIIDPTVANNSLITLKRPNYGGHYVFGVENVPGSYFLKVDNKNKQNELEYLINYYYYDQINPYDSIDPVNYNVNYKLTAEGLNVTVNPPILADDNNKTIFIKSINYWVYASDQKQHLVRYSRCSISSPIVQYDGKNSSQMFIPRADISQLLNATTDLKSFYLNVEASISVQIINLQNSKLKDYPTVLTILYNTIEIQPTSIVVTDTVITEYAYWFTDSLLVFIGWMILPFALAALFLLYGIKYCLTKLVLYQRDMMVEEEIEVSGGTSQTLPSDAGLNKGDLVQPDSALQNIKEHV